jgi:hypothetical protein
VDQGQLGRLDDHDVDGVLHIGFST